MSFYWPSLEEAYISSTYILLDRTLSHEKPARQAEKYSAVMCLREKQSGF